ncbi:MAG: siphovirus Gp157 family protein [Clostridia bacterium]
MNNLSLYEITSGFPALMESEEITQEEKEKIQEELTVLLQQKSQNIIGYTKNIELTISAMKEEEKRISDNRKSLENKLINFKKYVKECMERSNITKIETALGTLSITKSPTSVEIVNEDEIPSEFKQEVVTVKIDKTKIKNYFKETGEIPEGTNIVTSNTSLRIK